MTNTRNTVRVCPLLPSPRAGRPCLYLRTPSPARALGRQIFTVWYGSHCGLPALTVKLKNWTQWRWAEYRLYLSYHVLVLWMADASVLRKPNLFSSEGRFTHVFNAVGERSTFNFQPWHLPALGSLQNVGSCGWHSDYFVQCLMFSCKSSTPHSQTSFGRLF